MKHLALLPLTLLALNLLAPANAQDYVPLLDEGRQWQVYEGGWVPTPMTYYTSGDTVFGGVSYQGMMQLYGGEFEVLMGWIREDAVTQQVFVRDTWMPLDSEKMYYDFDVEVGDTLISPLCEMVMLVSAVDEIQWANGSVSQRIELSLYPDNPNFNEFWVEGIGSMNGVLAPGAYQCTADWDPVLCCVTSDEGMQFIRDDDWIPEHDNCDTQEIDAVKELDGGELATLVFGEDFRLEGRQLTVCGTVPLRVYSAVGGLVKELRVGESAELPAAGTYLLHSPRGFVRICTGG